MTKDLKELAEEAKQGMSEEQKLCEHEFDEDDVTLVIPDNYWHKFCKKCGIEARKYNSNE